MKVSIVISYLNRGPLWRRTLKSIAPQLGCGHDIEIVAVNDAPPDEEFETICREFNHKIGRPVIRAFNTWRTMDYRGPAYPWNCAIQEAIGEVLIIQNPEVYHVGPVIERFCEALSDPTQKRYICARVMNLEREDNDWLDTPERSGNMDRSLLDRLDYPHRPEYVGPTNKRYFYFLAGIRREHMIEIGGLSEDFYMLGYEDDLHVFLLRENGFRMEIPDTHEWFGLHQWHPRAQHDPAYHAAHRQMSCVNQELQRDIRCGAPPYANIGRDWGQLPENAAIAL